ncbi:PadR family transcriptional regulator [Bacillus sp. JJ1533]
MGITARPTKEGMLGMAYSGGPMTEAMYYVLLALMHPNHGYQLMQAISEVSNGRVKMGPGTLYGVLSRMQKDGLISLAEDDGRRKTYEITAEGEQALRVEYDRLKSMIQDGNILEGDDGNE